LSTMSNAANTRIRCTTGEYLVAITNNTLRKRANAHVHADVLLQMHMQRQSYPLGLFILLDGVFF
jgi:hypothetical protein